MSDSDARESLEVSMAVSADQIGAAESANAPETGAANAAQSGDDQSPLIGHATERDRALQRATLALDIEFAERWVSTMTRLVDKQLDHQTFMFRKMAALKQWNRDRKREQHNVGFRFDPSRRKPQLVDRDVRKELARTQARLDDVRRRLGWSEDLPQTDARPSGESIDQGAISRGTRQERARLDRKAMPAARSPFIEGDVVRNADELSKLNTYLAQMISADMKVEDLANVSDDDIRKHYQFSGLTRDQAQQYIDGLYGISDGV